MNEHSSEREPVRIRLPVEIELLVEVHVTDAGQATISLGRATVSPRLGAPAVGAPAVGSSVVVETLRSVAAVAETVTTGSVEDKAYSKFRMQSLREDKFSWSSAVTCCVASHLAYAPAATVEQTFRSRFSLPCKFVKSSTRNALWLMMTKPYWSHFEVRKTFATLYPISKSPRPQREWAWCTMAFIKHFNTCANRWRSGLIRLAATRSLVITGHSLGGALAVIALGYWQARYKIRSVYTYGQPRVGLATFREFAADRKIDGKLFRLVNADDVITRAPPRYSHIGHLYRFDAAGTATQLENIAAVIAGPTTNRLLTADDDGSATVTTEAAAEMPALSFEEFEQLKAACEATLDGSSPDALAEGLLPNYFADHYLVGYLTKILKQMS